MRSCLTQAVSVVNSSSFVEAERLTSFHDSVLSQCTKEFNVVSPIGQNIQQGESRGVARGGNRVTLPPGQKAIRGFRFDLKRSDHEVREIGVIVDNDRLEVYNSDQKADESEDEFNWSVQWASITPMVVEQ